MQNHIVFIVSSTGDTDLAKETARTLLEQNFAGQIYFIPLTNTANARLSNFSDDNDTVTILPLEALQQDENDSPEKSVVEFIATNKITHAYIGVSSIDTETLPFDIALRLHIPKVIIVNEFMFKPTEHALWRYLPALAENENCHFAVTTREAERDIQNALSIPADRVRQIGHLSIDRALYGKKLSEGQVREIRQNLKVKKREQLIFLSGTTQEMQVDLGFVNDLLTHIQKRYYENFSFDTRFQFRFGIHPGIVKFEENYFENYLSDLLKIVKQFPGAENIFKIILTDPMLDNIKNTRLIESLSSEKHKNNNNSRDEYCVLFNNISGRQAADASDKIASGAAGALLIKASMEGKPAYSHDRQSINYMPPNVFSPTLEDFVNAERGEPILKQELELIDKTCPEALIDAMGNLTKRKFANPNEGSSCPISKKIDNTESDTVIAATATTATSTTTTAWALQQLKQHDIPKTDRIASSINACHENQEVLSNTTLQPPLSELHKLINIVSQREGSALQNAKHFTTLSKKLQKLEDYFKSREKKQALNTICDRIVELTRILLGTKKLPQTKITSHATKFLCFLILDAAENKSLHKFDEADYKIIKGHVAKNPRHGRRILEFILGNDSFFRKAPSSRWMLESYPVINFLANFNHGFQWRNAESFVFLKDVLINEETSTALLDLLTLLKNHAVYLFPQVMEDKCSLLSAMQPSSTHNDFIASSQFLSDLVIHSNQFINQDETEQEACIPLNKDERRLIATLIVLHHLTLIEESSSEHLQLEVRITAADYQQVLQTILAGEKLPTEREYTVFNVNATKEVAGEVRGLLMQKKLAKKINDSNLAEAAGAVDAESACEMSQNKISHTLG